MHYSILIVSKTFLLKIERSIVEREIRKERIEITSAKEIRVIGYQNPSPFRMQLLGFFSIRTSHRFHEYIQCSFLFLFFPSWRKLARIRNSSRWWGCGGVFYGFVGWTPRLILPLSSAGLLLLFGRGAARLEMETRRNEFLPFFIEHHESLERRKREQCPLLVCNVN